MVLLLLVSWHQRHCWHISSWLLMVTYVLWDFGKLRFNKLIIWAEVLLVATMYKHDKQRCWWVWHWLHLWWAQEPLASKGTLMPRALLKAVKAMQAPYSVFLPHLHSQKIVSCWIIDCPWQNPMETAFAIECYKWHCCTGLLGDILVLTETQEASLKAWKVIEPRHLAPGPPWHSRLLYCFCISIWYQE